MSSRNSVGGSSSSTSVREIILDEIELHASLLEEAIGCILHTLLFLRYPKKVTPEEVSCALLAPLTYAKCSGRLADGDVKRAIETLRITLIAVGPNISRGVLTLSYFTRKQENTTPSASRGGFFGFTAAAFTGATSSPSSGGGNRVVFERWKLPVVVNHGDLPGRGGGGDERDGGLESEGRGPAVGSLERERARDSCRHQVQLCLLHVFQAAAEGELEHMPMPANSGSGGGGSMNSSGTGGSSSTTGLDYEYDIDVNNGLGEASAGYESGGGGQKHQQMW